MADKIAGNALMLNALLDGNGNLVADFGILALVGAMAGAVADGEGVAAGLLEEIHGLQRIGISRSS